MSDVYITQDKKTAGTWPAHLRRKTPSEIVEYMTKHFRTIDDERKLPVKGANKSTAFLMEIADTYFDPKRWKNPFIAYNPRDAAGHCLGDWVRAAVIWYHGAEAGGAGETVFSYGYACD